ncbi:divalent-cation tolerance protein CutA [bacterium]|nr:divalent-cation tolerance protein CutA [bacterium]MCB2201544.1 divalent-cation tolerance protein CutA [bacterium]
MESIRIVYISIPRDEANQFGRELVENRLCACVNIIPKIESYFWWDGEVEKDEESLLLVKTTQERFPALMEWVREHHPYDVPEVISVPLADGLPEYVAWVKSETKKG